MTARPHDGAAQARTDAAITRVLAAEAEARAAVADCRAQASALITAAEARARGLTGRTEARLRRVHELADAAVSRTLKGLRAPPPSGADPQPVPTPADLERVLDTLIAEILAAPDARDCVVRASSPDSAKPGWPGYVRSR